MKNILKIFDININFSLFLILILFSQTSIYYYNTNSSIYNKAMPLYLVWDKHQMQNVKFQHMQQVLPSMQHIICII